MQHLFNSRCSVSRLGQVALDGAPSFTWTAVAGLTFLKCRIDLGFLRPGKDQPMSVEAGKVPPRFGVFYAVPNVGVRASDRITFVTNERGKLPVAGTFEFRVPPDEAQDMHDQHHIEAQVIEVSAAVLGGERQFPGGL